MSREFAVGASESCDWVNLLLSGVHRTRDLPLTVNEGQSNLELRWYRDYSSLACLRIFLFLGGKKDVGFEICY